MRTIAWRLLASTTLIAALLLVGCNRPVPLHPVQGTVSLKGKGPIGDVMVVFMPEGPTGPRAWGVTDAQGHYVLKTDDNREGAMAGAHRVIMEDQAVYGGRFYGRSLERAGEKGGPPATKPPRFSEKYTMPNLTPHKNKEVKPEANTIDLEVTKD